MKHALLIFLCVLSSNARAEWIEFSTRSNGDVHFYNNSRVTRDGDEINVWTRVRYKRSVMAASSYQRHVQLQCSENTVRILQDTFFTDKDWTKPAMATNMHAKPKQAIQHNSATKALAELLCEE
ncbi:MAG: surface-adhesin E family protein [Pseudomonadota bacterium]